MSVTITLTYATLAEAIQALGLTASMKAATPAVEPAKETPKPGKSAPSPQAVSPSAAGAATPSAAATPVAASAADDDTQPGESGPLYAKVRTVLLTLIKLDPTGANAKALLAQFGVDHGTKLKRSQHAALIAAAAEQGVIVQ